jgi:hypothetical protein
VRSCVIDGEAIVTDDKGLAVFELIRGHGTRRGAELCAFDLIELDGKDIRHTPIEERKRHLGKLLGRYQPGIVVNEFFEGDAQIIFDHVCKLGCEGIVSKRLGSRYRGGRSADWVKVKNPATGGTAARRRGLGLIWAVAPSLERVPGWAAREFKIAEIGTEAKPDARADRHDHDIVCYERRHA